MSRGLAALLALVGLTAGACSADVDRGLTVYSGRSESLVGPLIERFEKLTTIDVAVRYGDTAELAAQILDEGANSPADVLFAQDAGALGALEAEGRFAALDRLILERVPSRFRSPDGRWVGTSGRVRVIAYNPTLVEEADLPDSIFGLTDRRWKGTVGWAPTNGSFQAFVTALRRLAGEEKARAWLRGMKENDVAAYPNNDAIAEAIAAGEISAGLVNHYYPFEIREETPDANVEDHFLSGGDPGGLINVAGAGIIDSSEREDAAARFIGFLLSEEGQRYFVEKTFEYPLIAGVAPDPKLPSLDSLEAPTVDLSELSDLRGTLDLLKEIGLL